MIVFLNLRRRYKQVFYYKSRGECDFVAMERGAIVSAIQVCANITDDNFDREYNGLVEAMRELNVTEGCIVTQDQSDKFEEGGLLVKMIPITEFLTM